MRQIFITATDTDMGKTFVTTAILKAFLDAKFEAVAIKPVQTGCEMKNGKMEAPDVSVYKKANKNNDYEPLYAFKFPASPHFSASLENSKIELDKILTYVKEFEKKHEILLVEGAGGLFVPLNENENFIDLMQILNYETVLVCKNVLGMINHTLLSIEALKMRGVDIRVLVVNFHDEQDTITKSNLEYLKVHFNGIIIVLNKNETLKSASEKFKILTDNVPKKEQIDLEFDKKHLWHPYTSALNPLKAHGVKFAKGNKIYTDEGCLIDGMSSWWCAVNGYNNAVLNEAAISQINKFSHIMFGGLTHTPAINLGKKLLEILPEFDYVFYCDSGYVSVEVAMKMALQYQQNFDKNKTKFLTVLGGYHGDTFGAMSVCDPVNGMHFLFKDFLAKNLFAPRPNCPFDKPFDKKCLSEFDEIFSTHKDEIAAIILEPIVQGAGGMWFYHPKFLEHLRDICDKNGILLIFDEIATGFGRTGKMFAYNYTNIVPDIICIGKAMTGGFMSFAATLANKKTAHGISKNGGVFMHGPTFMANPLACAVAVKNIEILQDSNLEQNVSRIEKILKENLAKCKEISSVADVRVLGAIGVVEMKECVNVEALQEFFIQKGVFIRPFAKNIYIMPPFITPNNDLLKLCNAIYEAIKLKKFQF